VSATPGHAREVMDGVERLVWSADGVEVLSLELTWSEAS
jgi:hypothetical protein